MFFFKNKNVKHQYAKVFPTSTAEQRGKKKSMMSDET